MSDSETPAPSHPTYGGKSLQSLERPRYKSWRKKYRKMRHKFDGVLEENKRLFKEEQKMEGIAKRLREELDGLLELCMELNSTPSLPPELRFELSYPNQPVTAKFIDPNIDPMEANRKFLEYQEAVKKNVVPGIDLSVARVQMNETLAAQETEPLTNLEARVPHPISDPQDSVPDEDEMGPGYMMYEQEADYLSRLDATLQDRPKYLASAIHRNPDKDSSQVEDKHWAELTPRELERQAELMNPQSQHSWLKSHTKVLQNIGDDDSESLASHEASKPARKRGGKDKNLAKQVGDRAVERAREGLSPSAVSDEELPASAGKKRTRDSDSTYRIKGSKSSATKGSKRKRSGGEDLATGKRRRVDGDDGEDEELGYAPS